MTLHDDELTLIGYLGLAHRKVPFRKVGDMSVAFLLKLFLKALAAQFVLR